MNNDEAKNAAKYAVDLNYLTQSYTGPGVGGNWFKLTLNQVNCVQQVLKYTGSDAPWQTWTCSDNGCSCVGGFCSTFAVRVTTEGGISDLNPVSDCKYGNTVTYDRTSGNNMAINEIVIIGKQGKNSGTIHIYLNLIQKHSSLKMLACILA